MNVDVIPVGYGAGGAVGVTRSDITGYGMFGTRARIYYSQCYEPIEGYFSRESAWCRFKTPLDAEFEIYFDCDPPDNPDCPYVCFNNGLRVYGCRFIINGNVLMVTLSG